MGSLYCGLVAAATLTKVTGTAKREAAESATFM
jgi:hypothetical protein